MRTHVPSRPEWTCLDCRELWPCPTRRAQILVDFERAPESLRVYMTHYLEEAMCDLPSHLDLRGRFLRWTCPNG